MAKLKVGNGLADGVAVGPLVNAAVARQGESWSKTRCEGAKVLPAAGAGRTGLFL